MLEWELLLIQSHDHESVHLNKPFIILKLIWWCSWQRNLAYCLFGHVYVLFRSRLSSYQSIWYIQWWGDLIVRAPPLPQPDSSVPWSYPYMRSLPHHPRGRRTSFMSPIQRASYTLVHIMVNAAKIFFSSSKSWWIHFWIAPCQDYSLNYYLWQRCFSWASALQLKNTCFP